MAARLLEEAQCRAARPRDKVYRLRDGDALSLQVMPIKKGGAKYWAYRYRLAGRQRMIIIGRYPMISLKQARDELPKYKAIVRAGGDPVQERKLGKLRKVASALQTFAVVAGEWLEHNKAGWSDTHYRRNKALLGRVLLPKLGKLPVTQIDVTILLVALRDEEARSSTNARKARTAASMIFEYAIASGRATENPARAVRGALKARPQVEHRKALTLEQVGPTLRAMDDSGIRPVTKAALSLLLYTGLRDFSLRAATWSEIDFDNALMTVAAERMKGRKGRKEPHVVPLPKQALKVLHELAKTTNHGPDSYIFPQSGRAKPMAEKTLCTALRTVSGVPDVTAHGCRTLINSALYEAGFRSEAIEVQLAHSVGKIARDRNEPISNADPQVRAAYMSTPFLDLRRSMMQHWADMCSALRDNKPLPRVRVDNVRRLRQA